MEQMASSVTVICQYSIISVGLSFGLRWKSKLYELGSQRSFKKPRYFQKPLLKMWGIWGKMGTRLKK
jgi:hypothetical protein